MRMEAIPGRTFYDYDGATVKDPVKTLADAGVNAIRVETTRGQCLSPTKFDNNATTRGAELTFTPDWGCIEIQVQTAQRALALGMRVVLTINQGLTIPVTILAQNLSQMLSIAGFSAYPDPMTPTDITSASSQAATLSRITKTLTELQGYAEAYGKYMNGLFAGQYKLQGPGVGYGTSFTVEQVPQEQE